MNLFLFFAVVTSITLGPLVVQALVSVVIPIGTGLVTKSTASPAVKQTVTIVLSGSSALIVSSTVGGAAVISMESLALAIMSWVIAIASYAGVYQSREINQSLAPERGIG